jgi:hypothetical protein
MAHRASFYKNVKGMKFPMDRPGMFSGRISFQFVVDLEPICTPGAAYTSGTAPRATPRDQPRFASNSLIYSTSRFTPSIGMAL